MYLFFFMLANSTNAEQFLYTLWKLGRQVPLEVLTKQTIPTLYHDQQIIISSNTVNILLYISRKPNHWLLWRFRWWWVMATCKVSMTHRWPNLKETLPIEICQNFPLKLDNASETILKVCRWTPCFFLDIQLYTHAMQMRSHCSLKTVLITGFNW